MTPLKFACNNCQSHNCVKLHILEYTQAEPDPIESLPNSAEEVIPTIPSLEPSPSNNMIRRDPIPRYRFGDLRYGGRHGYYDGHYMGPSFHDFSALYSPRRHSEGFRWEEYGIPTRPDGDAQYAIHRAVKAAYDEGYNDGKKQKGRYQDFGRVLKDTDKMESPQLRDRARLEALYWGNEISETELDGYPVKKLREDFDKAYRLVMSGDLQAKRECKKKKKKSKSKSGKKHKCCDDHTTSTDSSDDESQNLPWFLRGRR